jgi:uncharacterized protein (TIGR03435 family)
MRHDKKDLDEKLREHLLLFEKNADSESDSSRERIVERLKSRTPARVSDSSRNLSRSSLWLTPARIAACFVAVLIASAVFYRAFVSPDDLYAIVETTGGSVVQISQGKSSAANVGDKIGVDTLVRTGSGAEAKLKLPDGRRIEIPPNSELSLQRADDGLHVQVVPVLAAVVQSAATATPSTAAPIQSSDTPKWDVVSVKPCEPPPGGFGGRDGTGGGGPGGGLPQQFSADRMTLRCQSTWALAQLAYVGGPGSYEAHTVNIEGVPAWMYSELYTIEAKAEKPLDRAVMSGPMLQTLLEERFKLKIRREAREVPVLALTVAKGGLKMKPHQEGTCTPTGPNGLRNGFPPTGFYCGFSGGGANRGGPLGRFQTMVGRGLTIEQFIKESPLIAVGKPVIDKTGLTGKFDLTVNFAFGPGFRAGRENDFDAGPTFVDAIEDQLGLKLENTKGPWEHLVIEHVERPSPN